MEIKPKRTYTQEVSGTIYLKTPGLIIGKEPEVEPKKLYLSKSTEELHDIKVPNNCVALTYIIPKAGVMEK